MSTAFHVDLETLRRRTKQEGEALTWAELATRVSPELSAETLRVFATTPGRSLHRATRDALTAYFERETVPTPVGAVREAEEVLHLLREAVRRQERLLKLLGQRAEDINDAKANALTGAASPKSEPMKDPPLVHRMRAASQVLGVANPKSEKKRKRSSS